MDLETFLKVADGSMTYDQAYYAAQRQQAQAYAENLGRKWEALSRRQQRKWKAPCCDAPRPWKHKADCPLVTILLAHATLEEAR